MFVIYYDIDRLTCVFKFTIVYPSFLGYSIIGPSVRYPGEADVAVILLLIGYAEVLIESTNGGEWRCSSSFTSSPVSSLPPAAVQPSPSLRKLLPLLRSCALQQSMCRADREQCHGFSPTKHERTKVLCPFAQSESTIAK